MGGQLIVRFGSLATAWAAACAEYPLPPREQAMAAANWRPRSPDRLRCTTGPQIRAITYFTAMTGFRVLCRMPALMWLRGRPAAFGTRTSWDGSLVTPKPCCISGD